MAEMLADDDSTARHLNTVRRHQRRCKKTKGAAEFGTGIESARSTLDKAAEATRAAAEAEEDARDDIELADGNLDDEVVTVNARAEEYDRDHPGERVRESLFPTGRTTDVTEAPVVSDVPPKREPLKPDRNDQRKLPPPELRPKKR